MLTIAIGVALGIALAPAMIKLVNWTFSTIRYLAWSFWHPAEHNGFGSLLWGIILFGVYYLLNAIVPSRSVP